jgi:membrane-bound lytic murein transglycosylase B
MKCRLFAGSAIFLLSAATVHAIELDQPEVETFIEAMIREHDFDREGLRETLALAEVKPAILEAIAKPAEKTLTWGEYRKIFLTRERISAGAEFWREHAETLSDISTATGVPIEILVGIIGVETYFGRITGNYRVLDALATLAFLYPPRATFFRKELEQYLLLVREEGMLAIDATGSYAGAMGRPQFMPSSYRAYAVDSTGDGKRDIWNNWGDVAGSIANFFLAHRWKPGQEVMAQAILANNWRGTSPDNSLTPQDTVRSLSRQGVLFATDMPADADSQLLALEGDEGTEHWVGFHNFFVITRYNRSVMYALAVHQLGQEIAIEVSGDAS